MSVCDKRNNEIGPIFSFESVDELLGRILMCVVYDAR